MNETVLKHYLEILDLGMDATLEDVKQAYRDCVNVWHPDRFRNNPRLKRKAEKKLKEINQAHDTLTAHLSGRTKTADPNGKWRGDDNGSASESPYPRTASRAEAIAETGTRVFLTASFRIVKMLRRWIEADGP